LTDALAIDAYIPPCTMRLFADNELWERSSPPRIVRRSEAAYMHCLQDAVNGGLEMRL
jgi:hypothetical protein